MKNSKTVIYKIQGKSMDYDWYDLLGPGGGFGTLKKARKAKTTYRKNPYAQKYKCKYRIVKHTLLEKVLN